MSARPAPRGSLTRGLLTAASAVLLTAAKPVPDTVQGVPALPGAAAPATATLVATPAGTPDSTAPAVPMTLSVVMTRNGAKQPIQHYDRTLSAQLHVIAVSNDLRSFLDARGDAPNEHGQISVPIRLPHSGFYWVYADAMPDALGRQVFRFELRVGTARGASAPAPPPPLPPPSLDASDGAYMARFAPFTLTAGQDAAMHLSLLHDGQPAQDVTPYVGVPANAVLIAAGDHAYIPVEVAQVRSGDVPQGAAAPSTSGHVSPDLVLHATPPAPGAYRLFIEFRAGRAVHTVAFTLNAQ